MEFMVFTPLYQARVWGGRALETVLGRFLPEEGPVGESWEVVDRPEAQSVIITGELRGKSLHEALVSSAADVMGPTWPADRPFPLLVKWLDCKERLSLQVHPPADVAPKLGGEPKTENWYVAHTEGDAGLLVGLKEPVTPDEFAAAVKEERVEALVNRFSTQSGDSMFVPSGRLHAIDGGNLILEIQQNSDTTYRVYDWGRVGLDGKPRQLHLEESLASIAFDDDSPELIRAEGDSQTLVESDVFRLRRFMLTPGGQPLSFGATEEPRLLTVVSGRLQETGRNLGLLMQGDTALLPYAGAFTFEPVEKSEVLVTDHFNHVT